MPVKTKPVELENCIISRNKTVDDLHVARHDRVRVLYPTRRYRQRTQFINIFFHREYEFCLFRDMYEKLLKVANEIFFKFILRIILFLQKKLVRYASQKIACRVTSRRHTRSHHHF